MTQVNEDNIVHLIPENVIRHTVTLFKCDRSHFKLIFMLFVKSLGHHDINMDISYVLH